MLCDKPVHNLCTENTQHDRELIQRNKSAPISCGADLGYVRRGHIRCNPDCDAASDSPNDERPEGTGPAGESRRDAKEESGTNQQLFSPETIVDTPGYTRANKAAYQGTAVCPTNKSLASKAEVTLIKGLCTADHDPVVAEKEATEGCNHCDHPYISTVNSS